MVPSTSIMVPALIRWKNSSKVGSWETAVVELKLGKDVGGMANPVNKWPQSFQRGFIHLSLTAAKSFLCSMQRSCRWIGSTVTNRKARHYRFQTDFALFADRRNCDSTFYSYSVVIARFYSFWASKCISIRRLRSCPIHAPSSLQLGLCASQGWWHFPTFFLFLRNNKTLNSF